MIDSDYQVKRYITEFCKHTDQLLAEYDLTSFDLYKFQNAFGVFDMNNPMFDCYPIHRAHLNFIKRYVFSEPDWDFVNKAYFIESQGIDTAN